MPRKRYDNEVLRSKALELRGRGLSYREIAKELGCSVYKVHELLSPVESPKSRIKQVVELSKKVEELSGAVADFESKFNELKSVLSEVRPSLELVKEVSEIRRRLSSLEEGLRIVEEFARVRVEHKDLRCHWVDEGRGLCTLLYCDEGEPGCEKVVERVNNEEIVFYLQNVRKHPLICVACPYYKPEKSPEEVVYPPEVVKSRHRR
jgi:predicted transcriptional regulator